MSQDFHRQEIIHTDLKLVTERHELKDLRAVAEGKPAFDVLETGSSKLLLCM